MKKGRNVAKVTKERSKRAQLVKKIQRSSDGIHWKDITKVYSDGSITHSAEHYINTDAMTRVIDIPFLDELE